MDAQDIRTLKILQELDTDAQPSQRYLSQKLDISLGLVNAFLKRLAQKGYFKISTIPSNRIKYILTPKGALEKTRLTYEYIQYSFQFYRESRNKIKQTLKKLAAGNNRDIVFYGASDLAEIAYLSLQETPLRLTAVVDEAKRGDLFLGHRIRSCDALGSMTFDKVLVTSVSSREDPLDALMKKGLAEDKIILIQ